MKKLLAGLLCLGFGMSGYAATVTYGTSANWSSKTVNDADTVIINNGATVTLDTSDTATIVRVSNGATDGTLKIDQDYTLTVTTDFQLGTSTGSGVVTQSAGTVTARHLQINQSGTSAASRYYLSGGQITSTGTVTVATNAQLNISGGKMISSALTANSGGTVSLTGGVLDMAGTLTANGTVTINGGTVSNNIAGAGSVGRTIAGTDAVKVMSGNFILSGGAATDVVNMNVAKFEISGGNVNLGGQVKFAAGIEMKVDGNAAAINMFRLNDLNSNTFRFVFNSNGVSTINSPGYIKLTNATIIVDGSAYTGTAGAFDLFKGTSNVGFADTNNIHISGFDSFGEVYVTQNTNGLVRLMVGSYELTVNSGTGGGAYTSGAHVAISAAVVTGKTFVTWTGDTTYLADSNSASTTVTMPAQAVNLTATYVDNTYALTVNNGTGDGSYTNGHVQAIAADVISGKTFTAWIGDTQYVDSVTSASATVTMPATNVALTATYTDNLYTLTVNNGSGSGSYTNGQVVPITADTPASGYAFAHWSGDTAYLADSNAASTTVTMPLQAVTVTATYIATEQYTTNGTPYSWLTGYGLTNYEADAVLDQDNDGLKAWQEYIAGTNPTNAASVLKAAQATRNVVTWTAQSNRIYSVYWSTNLVKGFTNLADNIVYPQGSYTNTIPDARVNHYQIKVRLQP